MFLKYGCNLGANSIKVDVKRIIPPVMMTISHEAIDSVLCFINFRSAYI